MQMLAPLFKHFFPAWAVDNADNRHGLSYFVIKQMF